MEDKDRRVGITIHMLDMGMRRIIDANMKAAGFDEVTMMHGWILKYLYDNRDREIYQRDIEKQFGIGRSTVTTIIQLMEKRELIRRESVEHDARLKRVMLTQNGYKHHDLTEENILQMHKQILVGITEEEKETFLRIIEKMGANLNACKNNINGMKADKEEK